MKRSLKEIQEKKKKTYLFHLQELAQVIENFAKTSRTLLMMSSTHRGSHGAQKIEEYPKTLISDLKREQVGNQMKTLPNVS